MPLDFRIVLGFTDPAVIKRALKDFDFHAVDEDYVPLKDPYGEANKYDRTQEAREKLRPRLAAAYEATIKKLGGEIKTVQKDGETTSLVILDGNEYPLPGFSPGYYFDDFECGDQPGDGVFGIALDGRYRSILLDLKQQNSCGTTRDLDASAPRIQAAREALAAEFPIFAEAHLIAKAVFY